VPIITLINPSKTICVPLNETGKFRTTEMFIACVNPNEHGVHIDEELIKEADEKYHQFSIEQLNSAIRDKSFEKISIQDEIPEITFSNLKEITTQLNRIVNIN
jgi:hypothetical protein